jgi:cell shape-determining protein MreC
MRQKGTKQKEPAHTTTHTFTAFSKENAIAIENESLKRDIKCLRKKVQRKKQVEEANREFSASAGGGAIYSPLGAW